ncbi:cardiolipin synthase (CMP-forming) isoform X1 [Panthera pardus]|uniref:Cardiolipin synthase (CMP-forming) n=1 Tax=Panthera pardus TaxID=9691 RepID=A0A9V1G9J8_PANPR|nr:cardiolipin synthase (CMP-forming) isoform X1 [Panthera pardus]XP_023107214.1 cardiolipin synthase (CMP-forming) isoform X1 [Felis catus]XP_030165933.1 cardiolipin synthase (CMP-forming) isoform X1 [Lynx canadensis]XP_042787520.1 cardiolipin synthase (CMP-forming) isoform X1 [Panthera leo]XP_042836825.1 cardiolipin synthase (CMP-forming) isoform X1 [Panthera tigris]XP_043458793.1 cardiolipin synthase (CMP-forming) isoform X1 [Prionailurus bengalensis]XP_045301232.1 cardiolipin synthase (CM
MLASRVARGSWGALRSAAWAPGARPGKGRARGSLLRSVPGCLGCLVERWWLRPAALGLRLPGTGPRGHCSGAGKAAPGPAAGGGAAAEARAGRWGPASAASLYENPWTIPNMLSMTRIGLAPVLGYLIIEEDFNIALGVFALAGLTDLLDGFIARNWANQKSALGSALDPLADKILISILYVSLTYADLIPVPLTYMIISRDVMLIAAVFYVRYRTLPTPRTLSKYFNPCYATARLKPTFISKVNTAVQLILVAASLAAPVFNYADSIYLQILWCFTAFTTAASAYSYYHYGRKTVQVIKGR